MHTHRHTHTGTHTRTHIHAHTQAHTHAHTGTHTGTRIQAHTQAHTYRHTHTLRTEAASTKQQVQIPKLAHSHMRMVLEKVNFNLALAQLLSLFLQQQEQPPLLAQSFAV